MASNFYISNMKTVSDVSCQTIKTKKPSKTTKKPTKKVSVKEDEPTDKTKNDKNVGNPIGKFIEKTKTQIMIESLTAEPWGLDDDLTDRNKFKITVSNDKGNLWYVYWDTIDNTKENKKLTEDDVIKYLANTLKTYQTVTGIEDFRKSFGYLGVDDTRANKAYDGCKKAMGELSNMYPKELLDEFMSLV